jgi:large subunit ribosomal protein L29
MESSELREMTPDELLKKLEDTQQELFFLRARVAGQTPNPAKIAQARRDVARLKLALSEKGVKV